MLTFFVKMSCSTNKRFRSETTVKMNEGQLSTTDNRELLSTDQLLSGLDAQIKIESEAQKSEGWTRWAMWGAIATLIWVSTDLWNQKDMNLARMATVFILSFIIWKFIETAAWCLLPSTNLNIGPTKYRPSAETLNPFRPFLAVSTGQYVFVIGTLAYFDYWNQWVLLIYSIPATLSGALLIVSSKVALGFPSTLSSKHVFNAVSVFQLTLLGLAAIQMWIQIYPMRPAYTLADIRLGFAVTAIFFLVSRLVIALSSEHQLSKLVQLRQHVAFGRIKQPEAERKVEELLEGVTLEKLFQPLIKAINKEASKLHGLLDVTNTNLNNVDEQLNSPTPSPQAVLRELDKMGNPPTMIVRQLKLNKRAWAKFAGQAIAFGLISRESKKEILAIIEKVRLPLVETGKNLNACYKRFYELKREASETAQASHQLGSTVGDGDPTKKIET